MSGIRQNQRRAVEALFAGEVYDAVKRRQKLFRSAVSAHVVGHKVLFKLKTGEQVHLCGISVGVGTCSDIHGMNVAVFGSSDPERNVLEEEKEALPACFYAALLRSPKSTDRHADVLANARLAVEFLEICSLEETADGVTVWLEGSDLGVAYVPVLS